MKSLPFFLILALQLPAAAEQATVVERWFQATATAESVEVVFSQKRKLKTIKLPIKNEGRLWIDYAGDRFRWQTGEPPQTIVLRVGTQLTIVRTPGKRFEVRDLTQAAADDDRTKPKSGMMVLAGGFPRTLAEFEKQYRVLETELDGNVHRVLTKPIDARSESIEAFVFLIDAESFFLRGFEIELKDGSSIEMAFDEVKPNVELTDELFKHDLTGFKEAEFQAGR